MHWVVLALLAGCGFSVTAGDNDLVDAASNIDARPFDFADCPSTYLAINGAPSRYRIGASRQYRAAHVECKDESTGLTHLVVVDTRTEGEMLGAMAGDEYWTGTVQQPNAGSPTNGWHVIVGGSVAMVWAANEPDESGNQENNEYNVAKFSGGLDDDTATDIKLVVCECDGKPVDPTIEGYIPP